MSETVVTGPSTRSSILPDEEADGADQYVDSLVQRWDDLIDWERRKASEGGFFTELLHSAGAHRVLDAAAGTGFHSVSLAEAGFEVTALDGSEAMLDRAAANARERGHELRTVSADWRTLSGHLDGRYDAIVCLGSSFPHLFDEADRKAVLREFQEALNPGGLLLLDHRNFDAIRAQRFRSSGDYYYCGDAVHVSVDHADARLCRFQYEFADGITHHLEVYPVLLEELRSLLFEAGFDTVQNFGDFTEDFDLYGADFLIHAARKS